MKGMSNGQNIPLFTKWSVLQILLGLGALGVLAAKLIYGLGTVTNLSDNWPWGLWVAFDVGIYIAVAAGGFSLAAAVYIFKIESLRSVVKPAILIALLGYTIAAIGIFTDLGRSITIVHPIWMWQPNSVMFEVSWCVMAYLTVLFLEFSPNIFKAIKAETLARVQHFFVIPIVISGIVLSFLHQSSLGALFLITPDQQALWHSPLMGYLFLISAIAAGLSLVIFFAITTSRAWKLTQRTDVYSKIGLGVAWVLAVYLGTRLIEMGVIGNFSAFEFDTFGLLFLAEVGLFMALPMFLLFTKLRKSGNWLLFSTTLVFLGVVLNRLNVLVISQAPARVGSYFPSAYEILFTVGIVAGAMFLFRVAAKYTPVFSDQQAGLPEGSTQTEVSAS
jgi:Ni/Fe-hydrogenase subunit HybB-like protein